MMEPKRIYASEYSTGTNQIRNGLWAESEGNRGISFIASTKYIRADLVDQLKGYTVHKPDCDLNGGPETSICCTCGLSELLGELEE